MNIKKCDEYFDTKLKEVPQFKKYQSMMTYVGNKYRNESSCKILLIAESFYLPNESILHKKPDSWYSGNQTQLTEKEISWMNCRGLIECGWESSGHHIFRELNKRLASVLNGGFENVAFMNAFQRPACKEGESFRNDCVQKDIEVAIDTINKVQEIIKPDTVIFVAKYPWDLLGSEIKKQDIAKKYSFVCHPATGGRYWHNKNYKHGKNKFIELIQTAQNNANEECCEVI